MTSALLTVALRTEQDVVLARQRARHLARHLGFEAQDQSRIATAVSEIVRNVIQYAGQGRIAFFLEGRTAPQLLTIEVSDDGPGVADLETVLSGRYRSRTGMGLGILGARRLMDQFQIESAPGRGTQVRMRKFAPRAAPVLDAPAAARLVEALAQDGLQNPLAEVQHQNQELLRTLDELRRRQEELVELNRELDDTNRGVVALYAELDEKAEHLRRADHMKTRFLSNMSHEFRTPLNSILALAQLLQQRTDGDLTPEQEKQVGFILRAGRSLSELVDDLLDLAKVEAGKVVVRPVDFELSNLFGALRGMLRPLLVSETVKLVVEEPAGIPAVYGDEGKVSQILRNFLSNALKFTERGQVRLSAALEPSGQTVVLSVADTGIGIAAEDQARIFEEFSQVDHAMQRRVKGTGLGLALSRRLAEVLGGSIVLESAPGVGSTFSLRLPMVYASAPERAVDTFDTDPSKLAVLVLEDDLAAHHVYERFLRGSEFHPVPARTVREAEVWLRTGRPRALVLDIQLFGEDTWSFLARLRERPETRALPVIVVTNVDDERKALALGADAYGRPPVEKGWLLASLRRVTEWRDRRVLLVDDDDTARYLLRGLCRQLGLVPIEAAEGGEGLRRVAEDGPSAVLLDLMMPGMGGEEVLRRLRADAATERLPVVIVTSKTIEPAKRQALESGRAVVFPKSLLGLPDAVTLLADALRRAAVAAAEVPAAEAPAAHAAAGPPS